MSANSITAAVAKRDNGPGALILKYQTDFAEVLPSHIKPATFVRLSQGLLRRNADLAKAAEANPASFLAALLECARLGHEPGTDQFALVPFKDKNTGVEIVGIEQYQGVIERMYRAGAIVSVKAEVIKAADRQPDETGRPRFEWAPTRMDRPHHEPVWFDDRGELIGVYAYAEMQDGSSSRVAFLNRAEVMKHRAKARGLDKPNSPWKCWEESMWLKTAVHELEKWVPTSSEYRREQLRAVADVQRQSMPAPSPTLRAGGADEVVDAEVVEERPASADQPHTHDNYDPQCAGCVKRHGSPQHYFNHDSEPDPACRWCREQLVEGAA